MKSNTTLGLDLGIASIGWCLFENDENGNPKKVKDLGSFVFNQIEDGKTGETENITRRQKRLMRRQRRRRVHRLEDGRALFQKYFHKDFYEVEKTCERNVTPFELKVKGLKEKLSPEELMRALYHYLKYRGFKSNRKVFDKQNEDSKLLAKFKETGDKIAKASTASERAYVTEVVTNGYDFQNAKKNGTRLHNSGTEYNLSVTRAQYQDEINALLDKQISFGVIDGEFKNEFISLWSRQRDFSEGPSKESPYHVEPGAKIGICEYDGKQRAAKDSYSAKMFVLLSSLNNFLYRKPEDDKYQKLTSEQIQKVANEAIWKSKVTYLQLFKMAGLSNVYKVKGRDLTRRQYGKFIHKFLADHADENGVIPDHLDFNKISDAEYNKAYFEELFGATFFSSSDLLVGLHKLTSEKDLSITDGKMLSMYSFYDDVADVLLKNKTDVRIQEECQKLGYSDFLIKHILELKDVTKAIDLSYDLCEKLIPFLKEGHNYYESLVLALPNYKKPTLNNGSIGTMPDIDTATKETGIYLTNPVVKHTLVQLRLLLNAITKKYGVPTYFSVELARELKKNFKDRKQIQEDQIDNQGKNIEVKTEMLEKFPDLFKSIASIKHDDLLKYKLFKDQREISPYTCASIVERKLFTKDYEIDHILPYSQSFNDSFDNKVLVEAEQNQKKKDRTPYEYFGNLDTINKFLGETNVSRNKAINLRTKHVDREEQDFLGKDQGDSSYIATIARDLIDFYFVGDNEKENCRTISGGMTDKLKKLWGLSGHTHSFIADHEHNYKVKAVDSYVLKDLFIKREDGKPDALTFHFVITDDKQNEIETLDVPVLKETIRVAKSGKELNELAKTENKKAEIVNAKIQLFVDNLDYFKQVFILDRDGFQNIYSLYEFANRSSDGTSLRKEAAYFVLGEVLNVIYSEVNKKDRSNDLHHALDAAVIGCITPTARFRISNFFKDQENKKDLYDEETKTVGLKLRVPLPYDYFRDEILARVYERDEDTLLGILNKLPQYALEKADKESVHVLLPTRLPNKDKKGAISNDTIFGLSQAGELTKRISVGKLTKDNVEKIVEKEGGNKAVYLACLNWLNNKKPTTYPVLEKKGYPIKEVKIVVAENKDGRVDLSNGKFADNSDNIRVDFYTKNSGDGRLYAVPIFYYQLSREKIIEEQKKRGSKKTLSEPTYSIMFAQGPDGTSLATKDELKNNYTLVCSLPRYSLIEIKTKSGCDCLVYSGGASSGMFEVYSILGDDTDICKYGLCSSSNMSQIHITISTIVSLKLRNISILGKLN
jgi:CRISPR-associated endonuclease Csn1